jgi:hypothetical protein
MARVGEAWQGLGCEARCMYTRYVDGFTIRPLLAADTAVVSALWERLGHISPAHDLASWGRVDGSGHTLVAYDSHHPDPVGIARLARHDSAGEITCLLADARDGRRINAILAGELAADARAAGITNLHTTTYGEKPRPASLRARLRASARQRLISAPGITAWRLRGSCKPL